MTAVSWTVSLTSYHLITHLNKTPIKFNQGQNADVLIWQALVLFIIMLRLIILFTATCYACHCNGWIDWFPSPPLLHVWFIYFLFLLDILLSFFIIMYPISQWYESLLHKSITEYPSSKCVIICCSQLSYSWGDVWYLQTYILES